MSIFERMTKEELRAFEYIYNRASDFEKGVRKYGGGYHSCTNHLKQYNGYVPNWIRLRLQKFEGCNVIRSDDKSYLSFNINFGSKMSTRNRINFTMADYVYNQPS